MLILSNHLVIGKDTAKLLIDYVKQGGVILCDGKIGIVDERSMMNVVLPGGDFNEAMGCDYIDCDYEGLDFVCEDKSYVGFYGRELLGQTDGDVIGRFADGNPAVIEKQLGAGRVITVATYLWYSQKKGVGNAEEFASALADRFELRDILASAPLRVRVSENEEATFAFVFNYTNALVSGEVRGCGFEASVEVPANDVVILKREKKA